MSPRLYIKKDEDDLDDPNLGEQSESVIEPIVTDYQPGSLIFLVNRVCLLN